LLVVGLLLTVGNTVHAGRYLSAELWGRVDRCANNFNKISTEELFDYVEVDDSENGYLDIYIFSPEFDQNF
jgi:hypothetical protein